MRDRRFRRGRRRCSLWLRWRTAAKRAAISEAQERADAVAPALSGVAGATTANRAIEPGAQERAGRIGLRVSDFPDFWRASSRAEKGNDELRRCLGIDYSDLTLTGYVASDEFALADGTKVTSVVRTYATEAEAVKAFTRHWRRLVHALGIGSVRGRDRLWRTFADDCVRPLLPKDEDFHSDIQVGWYQFDPYRPPADYFDSWRITVRVRGVSGAAKGSSATAFVDLHIQQQGNTSAAIRTQRARRPFDPGVQEDLLQAVTERMSE
jgi:hypothetical protein